MRINKLISLLLVIMLTVVGFNGCSINNDSKTVIFVSQEESGDYWINLSDNIKKEAEGAGYKYEYMGPKEWDAQLQAEVINKAVQEKPCAIILAPIGSKDLFPAIEEANKSDIPIILIDNDIDRELIGSYGAHVTTYIGIDNYGAGSEIADIMAKKLSKDDKVAVLRGDTNSENGEKRCDGFRDEMIQNGFDVVAELATDGSTQDGYSKAKLILRAYPDLKAVFAMNSSVYKGVEQASVEYNIPLVSATFDYDDRILKSIDEGRLICTFDQSSDNMAKTAIGVVNKLMNGEKVEDVTSSEGKILSGN